MGDAEDIGPEVTADDIGIGLGGILVLRPERVLPDAVLGAITTGIRVADDLDHPLPDPLGLQETIGLESAEGRPPLFTLGALLDDDLVRQRLALLLREQHDSGFLVDDNDLVRLRRWLPVDPDIEVILPRISGLQGQITAGESNPGIHAAPVKGNGAILGDERASDVGNAAVRRRDALPRRSHEGSARQEQSEDKSFHIKCFYPTYSDGGTPNCFLKEVEKWERVLKPVI